MSGSFEHTPAGRTFCFGRHAPEEARAAVCAQYRRDDEEETEDDTVSCYNCRYRRWTVESFVCMRKGEEET